MSDSALVLPVGHLLGAVHPTSGSLEHSTHVRVGPELVELDDPSFTAWALAHGLPDRPAGEPWTRAALLGAAADQGLGDLTDVVDALLADRLLVEVDPASSGARTFAQDHRLLPLALGLGNDPADPGAWTVGLLGHPLVQLTPTLFDVFEWTHRETDLWSALQGTARAAREAGRSDAASTDLEQLLPDVLGALHALLSVNVVCLDTRLEVS